MSVVSIWDFRRGDHDDNRTSSQRHGLLKVGLAAALEFNFLKAFVGFLTLIIGPALLVGIAPSLLVSYGRLLKIQTATAESNPIIAVVLIASLIAVALWIGRPLLTMAVGGFWHLHYILVFPIFTSLREILRTIGEWFPARSITPEQHEDRRRLSSILAGFLLASGGLTVAITRVISAGFQLVDVERAAPLSIALAAMSNAVVILGLSTTVECLYWLWRELKVRRRILDWTANSTEMPAPNVRVAHLSDLHVVAERYGYRMEAGTKGPRGNRRIRAAFRKLAAIHAAAPVDRILVTGDITDAGTRGEWAEFLDLLQGFPELQARLSFVPGNHDLNIVDRINPGRVDLPGSASQSLRMLRLILALDEVQGDRVHVVDRKSGALGPSLRDYLREGDRVKRLRALAHRGAFRGRREMAGIWDAIFPLVEPANRNNRCGVILLNSNAPSHFSLTNAIGVVSPAQLKALKAILRDSPHCQWLILLHHHVVEYPGPSTGLLDRIGLALVNSPDVLAAIAPHASRVVVLHGHRHRDWIGTCGDIVLCSAPSVTLNPGLEKRCNRGFHIHQLATGIDDGLGLISTERVRVP